jgi:lipoic acid synthetase
MPEPGTKRRRRGSASPSASTPPPVPKPAWLKIRIQTNDNYKSVRDTMGSLASTTVCEEARCPNIYECWGERTATFMILGDVCTRRCGFCAVMTGTPSRIDPTSRPIWRRRWRRWGSTTR